jgi:acetyl/propionyl-CoA carboxylase alpha subunit/acetyl-CoA carboxylase carboxyltransferase component
MERPRLSACERIGILNRGEAALRFIRAVKDYNALHGASLQTVALYVEAEKDGLFVQQADRAVALSAYLSPGSGAARPYLDRALMLRVLAAAGCGAAWAGWGFLSEDPALVRALEQKGLVFLGPSSRAMSLLGDKIAAKSLAERCGVPLLPWSGQSLDRLQQAREAAAALGYPCILKAPAAGGGRGIRVARSPEELPAQYRSAREEALRVTGDGRLFIERLVERARHLEVQALGDRQGNVLTFGVRDCSVQRRNQKILEETPAPVLEDRLQGRIEASAQALLREAGYESAGTVEFLFDLADSRYYFLEVNTRLQVEHPVTEQAYGIDLVQAQIDVAMGRELPSRAPARQAAAVEVRLNAEDPQRGFTPSPGRVARLRFPAGPGIRVDSGVEAGSLIPGEFDSMIAKIIAFAPTRGLAYARLARALGELELKIEGGTSNRAFLAELIRSPELARGGVSTRFVEELLQGGLGELSAPRPQELAVALMAAAVERYRQAYKLELANFTQQAASGGSPRRIAVSEGQKVGLRYRGSALSVLVRSVAPHCYLLRLAEGEPQLPLGYLPREHDALLDWAGRRFRVQVVPRDDSLLVEVEGRPFAVELESGGLVRAPAPAVVLSIPVSAGQEVGRGAVLAVLEAMKMEMTVSAPDAGTVREVLVRAGEQVPAGKPLLSLELEGGSRRAGEEEAGAELSLSGLLRLPSQPAGEERWNTLRQEYLAFFLGYDRQGPGERVLERLLAYTQAIPDSRDGLARLLVTALEIFADVEKLFAGPAIFSEQLNRHATYQELLAHFFRRRAEREQGLPKGFVAALRQALSWYLAREATPEEQNEALLHIYKSHAGLEEKQLLLQASLAVLEQLPLPAELLGLLADRLDEAAYLSQPLRPSLSDAAIHARYVLVDRVLLQGWQADKQRKIGKTLRLLARHSPESRIFRRLQENLVGTGQHVLPELARKAAGSGMERELALEILARRFTRDRDFERGELHQLQGWAVYHCRSARRGSGVDTLLAAVRPELLEPLLAALRSALSGDAAWSFPSGPPELILLLPEEPGSAVDREGPLELAARTPLPASWLCLGFLDPAGTETFHTFVPDAESRWREDPERRGFNPRSYRELRVHRLARFKTTLLYSSEWVKLLHLEARENPKDQRLIALAQVPSARLELDELGRIRRMVALEDVFMEAVYAMRAEQARRRQRLYWNRIVLHVHTVLNTTLEQNREYAARLAARTADLGLEKIVLYSRRLRRGGKGTEEVELLFENISGPAFSLRGRKPSEEPLAPMDTYVARVVRARQRGVVYPYEILKLLTRPGVPVKHRLPKGEFEEFDIRLEEPGGRQQIVSVKGRPYGHNTGNVVFGLITSYPEFRSGGMSRVILLADPTADMGSLAEAECRRVIAALDLAAERGLPVEWLPVSAGARIDMESGTENLDWTARALRRIVAFTQAGGEINVIVAGVNIGAQSYWNAEATMLMHTRGLLIMTDDAAMLLTGKRALDFSGGVSAEDNVGIGGAERIMGPNGQAQVRVRDLHAAYQALFRHYQLTWRDPGERWPERAPTSDPAERDLGREPYQDRLGQGFATIGDIFSADRNPERKKPFDMRQLMQAVVDRDGPVFERWAEMRDAETSIAWESRIGGIAAGLIGIESRPLARIGEVPFDGPEVWTGATLFPLSAKKIARAINAWSGVLPLVVLANLSGFDGSPESLRKLQLEYGAEIGRAVVNFRGPIVFVVTARYHGGAYVVFSKALNENLRAAALQGAFASVIGGAPAAAVVFPGLVAKETNADPRVAEARRRLASGRAYYQKDFDQLYAQVYAEKQAALAQRFDQIHSVERAKAMGSIDDLISLSELRPYLIRRLEEGMAR